MSKIKEFIATENWQKAFSLSRKFFFGLSGDEKRSIEIAADCLNDNAKTLFYERLGVDVSAIIQNAKSILRSKYAQ